MRTRKRRLAIGFAIAGISRLGQAEELPNTDIRDVYRSDPGRMNLRPNTGSIVPISVSMGRTNAKIGSSVAAEKLELNIGALVAAGNDDVEGADEKIFSLVIDGSDYLLDVVEVVFDPVFGMHHVLAAVFNAGPEAYARFTFDPESGAIAGTLVVGGAQRYRIISDVGAGQLVFPQRSASTDADDLVTSDGRVASSVARVERRHAQAERIAQIKPEIFSQPENGFTTRLVGGAIGNVDIERLEDTLVIARLLKELSIFTRATGDEEFEILSLHQMDDGDRRVTFRQLISGVPVDFRSTLYVDAEGSVKSLLTRVVDPSQAPLKLIGEQEAREIATEVIDREIGPRGLFKVDLGLLELEYDTKALSQDNYGIGLTPTWRVPALIVASNSPSIGEPALVLINAETAEASLHLNRVLQ